MANISSNISGKTDDNSDRTSVQIEVINDGTIGVSGSSDHISIPSEFFLPSTSSGAGSTNTSIEHIDQLDFSNNNSKNHSNSSSQNNLQQKHKLSHRNSDDGDGDASSNSIDEQTIESRQCWVCLATDDEEEDEGEKDSSEWIHPCRCSGTAKWVHQDCLQKWIDEKQKFNSSVNVTCTQCNTEYVIVFPRHGRLFYAIELCDRILYSASPLAAITCIVGSIYWSAVCYGAFTIMQIFGKENGKIVIERSDPLVLLVGLPSIPVVLVLSKLIRWEDQILKLWLKNNCRLPLLGYILGKPAEKSREFAEQAIFSRDSMSNPISICRNFCSALILPTAATFFGGLFFDNLKSNFSKVILGGLTFVLTKGFIKILLRQNQYIRQTHRKILNFDIKLESPE